MIKLFISDIDHTLYSSELKCIPQANIDAIKAMMDQGIVICLATSRIYEGLNGEDARLRALMNRYDWLKPQYRVRLTNLAGQYKKVADMNKKAAAAGHMNASMVARQAQLSEQIYAIMREAEGQ